MDITFIQTQSALSVIAFAERLQVQESQDCALDSDEM